MERSSFEIDYHACMQMQRDCLANYYIKYSDRYNVVHRHHCRTCMRTTFEAKQWGGKLAQVDQEWLMLPALLLPPCS